MEANTQSVIVEVIGRALWPLAILTIAIIFFLVFRVQIAGLLNRTRQFGKQGLLADPMEAKATEQRQEQSAGNSVGGAQKPDNLTAIREQTYCPTVGDKEGVVRTYLDSEFRNPEQRDDALIRLLASALVALDFERVDRMIFGSQLSLLVHANAAPQGLPKGDVEALAAPCRDHLKDAFSFDAWLNFLTSHKLVVVKDDTVRTTPVGRDYLAWIIKMQRPPNRPL